MKNKKDSKLSVFNLFNMNMLSKKTFTRLIKADRYEDPKDGSGDNAGIKILSDCAEQEVFDALQKNQTGNNNQSNDQEK